MKQQLVNVVTHESEDVAKRLEKVEFKLHNKYSKKREIKLEQLKHRTPFQKAMSKVTDVLCVVFVLVSLVMGFSIVNSKIQKVCPSVAGYSLMQVVSGSMVNSGFNKGDNIVIRSVDTDTLKRDDKIAFYVYYKSYKGIRTKNLTMVEDGTEKTKYSLTFPQFFGFQSEAQQEAGAATGEPTFHHIKDIYVDANGKRWFTTYGSSNPGVDSWCISEDMVIGIYDDSGFAVFMAKFVKTISSYLGLILMLVPLGVLIYIIVKACAKNLQLAQLELDCVEEKRKITDPICVNNNVGFRMKNKTKYKILAQAKPEEVNEYIKVLWKDGHAPDSVRKYYLRKQVILRPMKQMLEVNRECEKMYHDKVPMRKIAKYYDQEKEKVEQMRLRYKNMLKHLKEADLES